MRCEEAKAEWGHHSIIPEEVSAKKRTMVESMERALSSMEALESFLSWARREASLLSSAIYQEAKSHPDLLRSAICGVIIAFTLIIVFSYFPGEPFHFNDSTLNMGSDFDHVGEALKGAVEEKITEDDEKNAEERIVNSKKLQKLLGMTGSLFVFHLTSLVPLCVRIVPLKHHVFL